MIKKVGRKILWITNNGIKAAKSFKHNLRNVLFDKYAIPLKINERISKAVLKRMLPANPVIIDCGAHNGTDTVELATLFKSGVVHAFEPISQLYSKLSARATKFDNIRCYQVALADRDGVMDFFISEGESDASSSLLKPQEVLKFHPDTFFKEKISVTTRTLDSWAFENNIPRVDMLWLDMQGYELQTLQASKKILDTVSVIHTEVSTRELYAGIGHYKDYRIFLESKGFTVVVEAIPKGWVMGNALFVKK